MDLLETLDLSTIPNAEDDRYEFKCSKLTLDALKPKLAKAASAFWNTGGGTLIAGVDNAGKPDGGIPLTKGRKPIREWVDIVLNEVKPTGKYCVRLFEHDANSPINIAADHCILAVEFAESRQIPHMAPDNTYYIRAGAHSLPAAHYIVEALFARRRVTRPSLVHTFRFKPDCAQIIQLGIVALSDEPALEVSLTFDPLPTLCKNDSIPFPRVLPLVDKANPFFMDLVLAGLHKRDLGENVQVRLEYQDTAGNTYPYAAILDLEKSYVPYMLGTEATERIAKAAESLDATMKDFLKAAKRTGEGDRASH